MTGARIVQGTAKAFLGVGVLLLAFVAYQLWGTALYEHSAQARLQQQLKGALHANRSLPKLPSPATGGAQPVLSSAAPPSAAPPVGNPVGLMSIPAIGVANTAIVEGTAESQLQQGPGHYPGTPLPGEAGNAAIAGHRTTYGAPFYHLDALKTGDVIDVETPQGLFGYQVVKTSIVAPSDTSVLQPSVLPELTLTTCNPRYSATQRLVVQALLRTSVTNSSFRPTPPSPSRSSGSVPRTLPGDASGSPTSGSNVSGGITGAVLWGLAAVVAAVAAWFAYRRLIGARRLLSVLGLAAGVYFLLACFQHVSLALPASF